MFRCVMSLTLDSRYVFVALGRCSSCNRRVDRLIYCSDSPHPCEQKLCWRCWVGILESRRGSVRCSCGSRYGGLMSRFDCDEFQSLWLHRFGYRS